MAIFTLLNEKTTSFEVALICVSLMCGVVDYVAPYAVGLLFLAFVILCQEGSQVPWKWFISYGWIIALLLAPKGVPVSFWHANFSPPAPTYTSLLGGVSWILLIVLITIRVTTRESIVGVLKFEVLKNANTRGTTAYPPIIDRA